MVSKQIILLFIIIVFFNSCHKKTNKTLIDFISMSSEKQNKNNYCFYAILDSLNKTNYLNNIDFKNQDTRYYKCSQKCVIQNTSILKFYEYTNFNEEYVLENSDKKYLILIGKARGATGIGVDYWSYEFYSLDEDIKILEFASLAKTPHSIFFNKNNQLYYITVDDNYPRPAGSEVKLDYYPVIGSIINKSGKVVEEIYFKCR